MKCCKNVIVTLCLQPRKRQVDVVLPAFMPIGPLREQLLEVLSQIDPMGCSGATEILLRKDGQKLEDDKTLAQYGIWDGSILDVLCQEG